ncbi:uncharacterized protein LOC127007564 [Eriocheir sinensis]|uniref:uncharacterized protein LOC127007564 n=1 Tax=Eriocheir sinensis TaxID=95602 RepID=UPI0021C8FF73|nr:uncharacterized protein LOC127007564 [Eriocheir sinensis]
MPGEKEPTNPGHRASDGSPGPPAKRHVRGASQNGEDTTEPSLPPSPTSKETLDKIPKASRAVHPHTMSHHPLKQSTPTTCPSTLPEQSTHTPCPTTLLNSPPTPHVPPPSQSSPPPPHVFPPYQSSPPPPHVPPPSKAVHPHHMSLHPLKQSTHTTSPSTL